MRLGGRAAERGMGCLGGRGAGRVQWGVMERGRSEKAGVRQGCLVYSELLQRKTGQMLSSPQLPRL